MEKQIRINLGCGSRSWKDWYNVDIADYPHIHHNNIFELPFKDNEVDLIYTSHTISYLERQQFACALREWKRVLKPNGILRIATPDFEKMAELYTNNQCELKDIIGPLFGAMEVRNRLQYIHHVTTYDFQTLSELLKSAGFKGVKYYNWWEADLGGDDHSMAHLPHDPEAIESGEFIEGKHNLISLNVECKKP